MGFAEYVAHYKVARSEGLLLRYLTDAYKGLVQNVPEDVKTDELLDLTEWLGELVRQVDSSLLDEWERLKHPDELAAAAQGAIDIDAAELARLAAPPPVTANRRAFTVMVRNEAFRRVELAGHRRWSQLGELDADAGWDDARWRGGVRALPRRARPHRHRRRRPSGARFVSRSPRRTDVLARAPGHRRPRRRPRVGSILSSTSRLRRRGRAGRRPDRRQPPVGLTT